jgi:hypothetical protein
VLSWFDEKKKKILEFEHGMFSLSLSLSSDTDTLFRLLDTLFFNTK